MSIVFVSHAGDGLTIDLKLQLTLHIKSFQVFCYLKIIHFFPFLSTKPSAHLQPSPLKQCTANGLFKTTTVSQSGIRTDSPRSESLNSRSL